jgi:hypothetical protein
MNSPRPKPESFLPLRPVEFEILLVLAEGDHHGYAIIREAESRSAGGMKLETGTLPLLLHHTTGKEGGGGRGVENGSTGDHGEGPRPDQRVRGMNIRKDAHSTWLARRVFRVLLLAYPADVRKASGSDMEDTFCDSLRATRRTAGLPGTTRLWLRTVMDVVATAITEGQEARRSRLTERRRRRYEQRHEGASVMAAVLQDLKYAARMLRASPGFTAIAIIVMGLGIGANTMIFSIVNKVLLEPLPFHEPHRLVRVFNSYPNAGAARGANAAPDYFFRRERVDAFQEVAAYQYWGNTVGEPGSTERVRTMSYGVLLPNARCATDRGTYVHRRGDGGGQRADGGTWAWVLAGAVRR